jgi:hypothetical protein
LGYLYLGLGVLLVVTLAYFYIKSLNNKIAKQGAMLKELNDKIYLLTKQIEVNRVDVENGKKATAALAQLEFKLKEAKSEAEKDSIVTASINTFYKRS